MLPGIATRHVTHICLICAKVKVLPTLPFTNVLKVFYKKKNPYILNISYNYQSQVAQKAKCEI